MAVTFGTVLAAAWLLASAWPATYRSTGTLRLDLPATSGDVAPPAGSSRAEQRWQEISRRVLTPAELLEIDRQRSLYDAEGITLPPEALVERMSGDIALDMVGTSVADRQPDDGTGEAIIVAVGYQHRSPDLAAQVANDLVALYLRQNPEQHKVSSAESFNGEAEMLRERIAALEQRVTEFKRQHTDRLPAATQANQQQLGRARQELRNLDDRIRALDHQIAARDPQLEEARSWLAIDRERYAPDHPSVRQLEQEVASLEQRVKAQRQAALEERAAVMVQRGERRARLEELEQAQLAMPAVEREYAALTHELQDARDRLAEVREQAKVAGRARDGVSRHYGARFTLIEPPQRPQVPIRPNRIAILALGLLAALGSAVAIMLLLEARDPRVRGPRAVAAALGEPPLVVIPWLGDAPGAT